MALFFNGQCRLANTFLAKVLGVKFSLTVTWKPWKIKFNGRGWSPHGHVILYFLPLIDHNLLLVYYWSEYKGNFYKCSLYYTWVQMLLQIGPLLRLGSTDVITDGTFITLGSKCYYRWDLYYTRVQLLHLCLSKDWVIQDISYCLFSSIQCYIKYNLLYEWSLSMIY